MLGRGGRCGLSFRGALLRAGKQDVHAKRCQGQSAANTPYGYADLRIDLHNVEGQRGGAVDNAEIRCCDSREEHEKSETCHRLLPMGRLEFEVIRESMGSGLSPRLAAVAAFVKQGVPMADIGTDHAQLPIWLVGSGWVPSAVAMDVAVGPIRAARSSVKQDGSLVDVRMSDGMDELRDGEVATVTICGMGGRTMAGILSRGLPQISSVERVVLQAQGFNDRVRQVMLGMKWTCANASIVKERNKLYVVECWVRGLPRESWCEADLRWGQNIRRDPDPLFREWLERELKAIDSGIAKLQARAGLGHRDEEGMRSEQAMVAKEMARLS